MKGYKQDGTEFTAPAPYAVESGGGALIGSLFGVAKAKYASGARGVFVRTADTEIAKATGEAWAIGAKVYWDNTNKRATTTATNNTLIGVAVQAQVSADTVGRVILTGQVV